MANELTPLQQAWNENEALRKQIADLKQENHIMHRLLDGHISELNKKVIYRFELTPSRGPWGRAKINHPYGH